ncbi:RIO kinase [Ceratobasidium sp. AG-Ba]|nr:RIO kinase [Ceratobasidium sp. AG-Ba]
MPPSVLRSKSAPTTKPLSAHFIPKNVSFSTLDGPNRVPADLQLSEVEHQSTFGPHVELYRSPVDSPLTQRVEAFNLSGGFFPSQADEYDWVSAAEGTAPPSRIRMSSGLQTPSATESPTSVFSSLPATPGAGLAHRPLPDELDDMATEAIKSEDKMGVLNVTGKHAAAHSSGAELKIHLSPWLVCVHFEYCSREVSAELPSDAEPLSDDALYSMMRSRRQEATTPGDEQAKYGELFLSPDSEAAQKPRGWSNYLDRLF